KPIQLAARLGCAETKVAIWDDLAFKLIILGWNGDDKFPIIIAKDLKDEEKIALIKVLKSHKQALAWQLSDIKGINLKSCTHKILMEDDFKPAVQHQRWVNLKIREVIKKEVLKLLDAGLIYPISNSPWMPKIKKGPHSHVHMECLPTVICLLAYAMHRARSKVVQHQRRVNPKIHEVIKKEVLKFLDAGLIYPISDSAWVSSVQCVPKKGGFTVVEIKENELIPTRLTPKIKKRPHSRVLTKCLPTVTCLMAYAMHRARSKGEKSFHGKEGIVLGHKISKNEIEVDKAKVDVIAKLPHPTTVKEGDDKLPVIISKDLKDEKKTALIKVLKSHKQALTWQLFDTKDRSISCLVEVAKDVFVKTGRALIDVYEGELTLHVGKEAITFNLDQISTYSANYNAMSVNQINLIDVACEEYSQEVLGFSMSSNPTPSTEPIVSNSSPTLTPFEDSDFLLEETDAFL
nr:reverse transcriptase domain-containing protein [Tanacetum cinerariifolium]